MSDIGMICMTALGLILAGVGLGKVMFERGYVHGYEVGSHQQTVEVDLDGEE